MPPNEEILGEIEYVKGGLPSWVGYHNLILTNKRVIVSSIQTMSQDRDMKTLMKTNWRDLLNPIKDMVDVEKNLMMPLDKILSQNKSIYTIRYDEMKSLKFSKDLMEIHVSFAAHNRTFSFSFPSTQHRSANRWNMIHNRLNQMNICPSCKGKLIMGDDAILTCNNCYGKYKMNILDFRHNFIIERRTRTAFKNKSTGALLAVCGTIFFIATFYTIYLIAQDPRYNFSDNLKWIGDITISWGVAIPCFFIFPLFIIITGVLVYTGSNSGKVMFGILCILFGLACNFAGLLMIFNEEEGARVFDIIFTGVGMAVIGYGIFLIRSSLRKNTQYTHFTR
jgi:hypothetical protein